MARELRKCRREGKKKRGKGGFPPSPPFAGPAGNLETSSRCSRRRTPCDSSYDGIISSRSLRKQAGQEETESEFPAYFVTFFTQPVLGASICPFFPVIRAWTCSIRTYSRHN